MPTGVVARATLSAPAGATQAYVVDRSGNVLTISLTSDQVNSPGTLTARVGNGVEGTGRAYFFYDGSPTHFFEVALDETGAAYPVYLPVRLLAAGAHTVRVSPSTAPPPPGDLANKSFTVVSSRDTGVIVPVTGTEPPLPDAPNRWVFQAYDFSNVSTVDTYVLPTNPKRMSRSFGGVVFTDEPTTVSNGNVITWEGAPKPPTWIFEGNVLSQADYRAMVHWGKTGQRFYVTDHFGHRYLVKVTEFKTQRVRDLNRPWHHTYTMTVSVLRGTGVL